MKRFVFIFLLGSITLSCKGQIKINDTSLKIDVTTATDACACNDIAISIMKEQLLIFKEMKKHGKLNSQLNEELAKRDQKHYEYYKHCKPIYEVEGMGEKCSNYKEANELDKEISKCRKEFGMQ